MFQSIFFGSFQNTIEIIIYRDLIIYFKILSSFLTIISDIVDYKVKV